MVSTIGIVVYGGGEPEKMPSTIASGVPGWKSYRTRTPMESPLRPTARRYAGQPAVPTRLPSRSYLLTDVPTCLPAASAL